MSKHQGIAKHVRTFSEATQIGERRIRWLTGWVTMSEEMKSRVPDEWKGRFPKVISVTNPIGVSAPYYRRTFIMGRQPLEIWEKDGWKYQYIPALVADNPSENAEKTISRVQGMGDAAIADALLNANWNALVGEFYPEWDEERHTVANFTPPQHYYRFRTFDWGTADPFAVYWWAISDGEPFNDNEGRERWFPRGAIIAYQEWYGCDPEEPSKGLRMRNEDVARGIVARSEPNHKQLITLTDSLPFQDRGGDGIHLVFAREGVVLTRGDTSRVTGWSQLRSRLIGAELSVGNSVPMIFFCECCKYARDYLPALPRHPSESKKEDAAEHGEATHAPDAIRLACMAHTNAVIKDKLTPIQTKIDRAIIAQRPTVNKILKAAGHAQINYRGG
jgi:hypothetical protein